MHFNLSSCINIYEAKVEGGQLMNEGDCKYIAVPRTQTKTRFMRSALTGSPIESSPIKQWEY